MATIRSIKNEEFLNMIRDSSMIKQAQERLNAVVRLMVREGAIDRMVMIPEYITYADLDRQADTDVPVKIIDVEPNVPAAVSVGYGTNPTRTWISARRVRATFNRIQSNEFFYDISLLGTWELDIQQVIADNAARDILAREDGGFFAAVDMMLGTIDTLNTYLGSYPYVTIHGGYTRETLQEAISVMYRSYYRLAPATAVLNYVTARRLMALGREEIGDDMAGQIFREGFSAWKMDKINWIATIKSHIVPDDKIYFFADPRAVGKLYLLEDIVSYMVTDAYNLHFFCWESLSQTIVNAAGLAAVAFA
ncbi:MAG: hypothetical protein QXQ37_04120 [Nitrososphaerota archaeon]